VEDSDDDHSLLTEKEEDNSDIDTIEEEVDMSQSEGSDRENAPLVQKKESSFNLKELEKDLE